MAEDPSFEEITDKIAKDLGITNPETIQASKELAAKANALIKYLDEIVGREEMTVLVHNIDEVHVAGIFATAAMMFSTRSGAIYVWSFLMNNMMKDMAEAKKLGRVH